MRIHDLSPLERSRRTGKELGEASDPATAELPAGGTRDRKPVPVARLFRALRAVKCPFKGGFRKEGSPTSFRKEIAVVNLKDLSRFEASAVVDLEALKSAGLVRKAEGGVKVLGKGDLAHPLTLKVNRVSRTAKEKIESAGGKVELL